MFSSKEEYIEHLDSSHDKLTERPKERDPRPKKKRRLK